MKLNDKLEILRTVLFDRFLSRVHIKTQDLSCSRSRYVEIESLFAIRALAAGGDAAPCRL
jgi:hypothetical protein